MRPKKIENYIDDLTSEKRELIVSAVETLNSVNLRPVDKDRLIEIVQNFQIDESMAPLWAMIILKQHSLFSSVSSLLDVLDSDYDYYREAAVETLISIARSYPDETLDLLEDFICQRIDHDPWDARLFAYGPVAALKENSRAKSFLIKMFEVDDKWRSSLANDLVGFGDQRVLVLFRRAIEFAQQANDQDDLNELRYAYAFLTGAPIRQHDDLDLWRKPWMERWLYTLEKLGKDQDAIDKLPVTECTNSSLWNDSDEYREFKKEQELVEKLSLKDFILHDYLTIRVQGWLEQRFDEVLQLLGLDLDWTVETVQILINESINPTEVVERILSNRQLSSPAAMTKFVSLIVVLWNETPREELNGLTPREMADVSELRAENDRVEKKRKKL